MPEVIERTIYRYDELSPRAKERAASGYQESNFDHDWWDDVYEDAITVAALLGINIDTHTVKMSCGREYQKTCIFFNGFCSQDNGACYTGHYRHPDGNIIEAVASYASQDEELRRIAKGLVCVQVQTQLSIGCTVTAKITTSGNYHHSNTMSIDVERNDGDDDFEVPLWEDIATDLTQLLRDFADWIYKQLKTENDYLYSEEHAAERFADNGDRFNENGVMI